MIFDRIADFFKGKAVFKIKLEDAARISDLLYRNGISYKSLKCKDKTVEKFYSTGKNTALICRLLDKSDIKDYSIKRKGLPRLLEKYKARWGLVVGIIIFVFTLWFSKLFVWEINVEGNYTTSSLKIESSLRENGFGTGSFIPKLDLYRLCNDFLTCNEEYSWVSVNIDGCVANVEVRERTLRQEEKEKVKYSNLIAKYSGQIDYTAVSDGMIVVSPGDVVKEGELLVSGLVEKKNGFDAVRSSGSVYAYVTRLFDVEVDYEQTVKCYTGKKSKYYDFDFFGKIFRYIPRKNETFYCFDEFSDRERLTLFDEIRLPIVLTVNTESEYITEKRMLTQEEARLKANGMMSELLEKELKDSEILEKKASEEFTETGYKLHLSVYCLADIALEKEILSQEEG